jgi:putative sigma-54 modulation protein
MQFIFTGKHIEVPSDYREYATSKLGKLARYFEHVQDVHLVESTARGRHIVEATLKVDGTVIRAEEHAPDFETAVDRVAEKLERQLKRYRSRFVTRKRESLVGHKPEEIVAATQSDSEAEEEQLPPIVRTKRFPVKPMDPEEAALEMELVGHDFYVFLNAESNQVNVVYRRQEGNIGLIEPTAH